MNRLNRSVKNQCSGHIPYARQRTSPSKVTGIGGVYFKATYDFNKFVHIMDLEGNKVQLWDPSTSNAQNTSELYIPPGFCAFGRFRVDEYQKIS